MTIALLIIALLLWFIWKQLDRIAGSLHSLQTIAEERHIEHQDTR